MRNECCVYVLDIFAYMFDRKGILWLISAASH